MNIEHILQLSDEFIKLAEAPSLPENLANEIVNWALTNLGSMVLYRTKERLLGEHLSIKEKNDLTVLVKALERVYLPIKYVSSISTKFELDQIVKANWKYIESKKEELFLKELKTKGWPERIRVSLILKNNITFGYFNTDTKNIILYAGLDYDNCQEFREFAYELVSTTQHELIHLCQDLLKSIRGYSNFGWPSKRKYESKEDIINFSNSDEVYPYLRDYINNFRNKSFTSLEHQKQYFNYIINDNWFFGDLKKNRPDIYNKVVREFYKNINWMPH